MKLTKQEKNQLSQDIGEDLPEYFSLFSPWVSLWIANIILSILGIGISIVIAAEIGHLPFEYAYGFGMIVVLFVCVANGLVVFGHRIVGTLLLKAIGYLVVILGLTASVHYFFEATELILAVLVSGCLSLLITHNLRFQIFAYHREQMVAWGRERLKKNKLFMQKVRAARQASDRHY